MLRTTKYKVPYRCKYCKAIFANKNDHSKHVQKHGISPNEKKKADAEARKFNEYCKMKFMTPLNSSFHQEVQNTGVKAIGEVKKSEAITNPTKAHLESPAELELSAYFGENASSVSTRHRSNPYNEREELVSHFTCDDCDRYFYQKTHLVMHRKKCSASGQKIGSKIPKLEEEEKIGSETPKLEEKEKVESEIPKLEEEEVESFEIAAKKKCYKIEGENVAEMSTDDITTKKDTTEPKNGDFRFSSHIVPKPSSSPYLYPTFGNDKRKVEAGINFANVKRKPVSLLQQLLTRNAKARPDYNFPIRTIATTPVEKKDDDNNYSCTTVKQDIGKTDGSNNKVVDKMVFRRVKPECYICKKKYANTSLVNEHILRKHFGKYEDENTVACGCDVCKATFKNFLAFQLHVCFAPYRCAFCDRTFKEMMEFQNHIHNHMRYKVQ